MFRTPFDPSVETRRSERSHSSRGLSWLSFGLLLLTLATAAFAIDWVESFSKSFHPSSGANHVSVAAHGDHAILAGEYAIDMLSFDPVDESWNLDFRINEFAAPGAFFDLPVVAIDGARAAYTRRAPGRRTSWEVRARFHFDEPHEWKTLIKDIPGPILSLDFSNQTRAVVAYDAGDSLGARIYEYNGSSFQHVATMNLGLPLSSTGLSATIDGDFAVATARQGQRQYDFWLVVYRRVGPGNWQFHQAIPSQPALSLSMDDEWLVAGSPFGGEDVTVYRRQGVLDFYQLDQALSSPSAGAGWGFGFDVEVVDDEIYVADWSEDIPGLPGTYHGAVHRFVHFNGNWQPSLRLVSSKGNDLETLGRYLSVTTDHVIATGGLDNGTFYSFDRPGVP